jgi:DNA polymerase-3 subunit delta'
LPTIRSRCRRLAFAPWSDGRIMELLARRGLDGEGAERIARLAGGSPGRALAMAEGGGLQVDDWAEQVMGSLARPDEAGLIALADNFRGAEGGERFGLFMERLAERTRNAARAALPGSPNRAEGFARSWERIVSLRRDTEALNLDRADAFWAALAELRAAERA